MRRVKWIVTGLCFASPLALSINGEGYRPGDWRRHGKLVRALLGTCFR